ncbi:MAG TPA: molybdopterin-dependent oxidoreductase, partial [Thermomicrobiales bacterium]|nr:molybdopterin-dependent oxidoreductase [Thermomicrobiales bacterium]
VKRPKIDPALQERLPPGQILAKRWPVRHEGVIPTFDPQTWRLRVWGDVARPIAWSWQEFQSLPQTTITGDMHCVARWSALDLVWGGTPIGEVLAQAEVLPEARFVIFHGEGGYAANLPLAALSPDVLLAASLGGAPLPPERGGPLRLIAPNRYAWKSVKWLRGIEFARADAPGFWERYGYSATADPWREERFAS